MNARFLALVGSLGLLAGAGCGTIDVAPVENVARIVNGTVRADRPLPAGAEIVVRVTETGTRAARPAADLPLGDRALPAVPAVERLLGEQMQTLAAATSEPVPFRVALEVPDETLRRGLNLEARVTVGGRVRFRTIRAHMVTLASSPFPQEISVEAVER